MFFKKKKKEAIVLPMLSGTLPELPEEGQKMELPSLPSQIPQDIPKLGESIEKKSIISEIEKHKDLEVPEMEEKRGLISKKESFVKIDHYQDMIATINVIKGMLSGTTDSISKAIEIKNIRDAELETWQGSLQDIGKRLMQIDKSLFKRVI